MSQESCQHTSEERQLTGVWTTFEVTGAEEEGYVVVKVHEVWHYSVTSTDLFKEYVIKFAKLKQEASGWPPNVKTDEEKEEYIRTYEMHEGVRLDPDNIEYNPGMRSLAKLMLNSLWGKFAQRSNMTKVAYCYTQEDFYTLLEDDRKEVTDAYFVSDDTVYVTHKDKTENCRIPTSSLASLLLRMLESTCAAS